MTLNEMRIRKAMTADELNTLTIEHSRLSNRLDALAKEYERLVCEIAVEELQRNAERVVKPEEVRLVKMAMV